MQERRRRCLIWLIQYNRYCWIAEATGRPVLSYLRKKASRHGWGEHPQVSEKHFRGVIENSVDAIALVDMQGTVLYVNSSTTWLSGYAPEELVGRNAFELIHPDDRATSMHALASVVQNPDEHIRVECRVRQKSGKWLWMEASGSNLLEEPGVRAIVGNFRDISARKQAEERLIEQARLLQIANDAFIVQNEDNCISFWSEGSERLYGYSEKEAVGKKAVELLHTQFPVPLATIHGLLNTQQTWRGELIHTTKAGKIITVDSHWELLENTTSYRILEVNRDITERKLLEQRKDEFISIASHELRTPVTSLLAYTQLLLLKSQREGYMQFVGHLRRMEEEINRLTNVIAEMLDLSKIQAGKLELETEPFQIDPWVEQIIESVQHTTTHHICIEGKANREIIADRYRLGQMLLNLLTNAIKYSPQADRIDVTVTSEQDRIVISVHDYGVGIAQDEQDKIFERFYRVSTTKAYPGLGLGLSICAEIIKKHNGMIWVESTEGKGSTFSFSVPLNTIEPHHFSHGALPV
jgi:two-component system, OmpR family, phosphate regulon sensor histidine kinase PhoR